MKKWRQPIWMLVAFIALFASTLPSFASLCLPAQHSDFAVAQCAAAGHMDAMPCCAGVSHSAPFADSASPASFEVDNPPCCETNPLPAPAGQPVVLTPGAVEVKSNHHAAETAFPAAIPAASPRLLLPSSQWLTVQDAVPSPLLTLHIPGLCAGRAPPVC